jgi:hypothetical protein
MSTPDGGRSRRSHSGVSFFVLTGLLLEAGAFAVWALAILIFDDRPWIALLLLAGALLAIVSMCALVSAAADGKDLGITRWFVWAQVGVQLALSAYLALAALDSALEVAELGPSNRPWLYLAGILFTAGLLVGCGGAVLRDGSSRLGSGRRQLASAVGIALAGLFVFGGLASGTVQTKPIGCSLFSFHPDRWKGGFENGDREQVAHALVKCETLIGKSRAQVRGMLGNGRFGRQFVVRSRTDFVGDVATRTLTVTYRKDGRVRSAKLSAPINSD